MTNEEDGAEGGTRTPTSYLTRPSNVRVYQFRHFGKYQIQLNLNPNRRLVSRIVGSIGTRPKRLLRTPKALSPTL